MLSTRRSKLKHAIGRGAGVAIVVIIIIIIAVGGYAALNLGKGTSSQTTTNSGASTSTSSTSLGTSTSSTGATSSTNTTSNTVVTTSSGTNTTTSPSGVPSSLIYETTSTPSYLDPGVSYFSYDYTILQNVYETLIWYNGSSSTTVVPWLASNYTLSANGLTANFTLRNGLKFQDGEPVNSTAVYFSLNRLLMDDSSSTLSHGSQASWIIQQMLNTSLSSFFNPGHAYNSAWAKATLAQNLVQITGPLTFTLHLQESNAAFPYLFAVPATSIIAPQYVMQHDLSLWTQSSAGYTLPYPTLSGNYTSQINQYLLDFGATQNAGITPKGIATTYLDGSYNGSLAGTGPYILSSFSASTNDAVMTANSNYWGGAYQFNGGAKVTPQIKTIDFNFVPVQSTRTLDLQSAAKSGQAMVVDVTGTNLYDVADRNSWLSNGTLVSTIPGVTLYGPYTAFSTLFDPFVTNVTNSATGQKYTFQPFADRNFRLAFADAVNMTEINQDVNNKLGQVAVNAISPGLPPAGSFIANDTPAYSFNPDASAQLLLTAMQNPITKFTLENGTAAPSGMFNNAFGCNPLPSSGKCTNPIPQTIDLYFGTGDTVDEAILNQIASVIENISTTYNMGLTVGVVPVPTGPFVSTALSGAYPMYALGWFADYPWVIDFTNAMYAPGGAYGAPDSMNYAYLANLNTQAQAASAANNLTGLVQLVHLMNQFVNKQVLYLWTFNSYNFAAFTSNIHGVFYNPSLSTDAGGISGPEILDTLY